MSKNPPATTDEDTVILVHLDGGLVRTVSSNNPALNGLKVLVIDYDVEGCDPSEIKEVDQGDGRTEEAYVREDSVIETEIILSSILDDEPESAPAP